ncbi:hypothetical protein KAR91_33825 [Candidatus Pacearchaeota archaeon]|nr:hypothetical protein [Candidatus Pacearchaeota archaeon]
MLSYAAIQGNPTRPKTPMNIAIGIALGLMLGIFWVFVA